MIEEREREAIDLLKALWRGTNSELKAKYARTVWTQYEETVRASAYTDRLSVFTDVLCRKMDALVGRTDAERARCQVILSGGHDRELLKLLREETTFLVLSVRVELQEEYT